MKKLLLAILPLLLTGCGGVYESIFEKDNTLAPAPLSAIQPEVNPTLRWSVNTSPGTNNEHLKLIPAVTANAIYISNSNGIVTAVNKATGALLWKTDTQLAITTGAAANAQRVVVGTRDGIVATLNASDGKIIWKTAVSGALLAQPSIENNTIIVKTVEGQLIALSAQDGKRLWTFRQTEPSLILRGSSSPHLSNEFVFAGFANGKLAKLSVRDGRLLWLQTIAMPEGAFAIERMIDIDADPIVYQQRLYVATYQGKIASLDALSGRMLWSHDISSYTGMTADDEAVYVSDAKSHVWAFNTNSGLVNWRQNDLTARVVTAPARQGNYIVLGDKEGYLHWLNKHDGHFAARIHLQGGVLTAPIADGNQVYILTKNGYLSAYTLN